MIKNKKFETNTDREKKLALELKENIKKRKAQLKARKQNKK